jgi:hypothetical protein
MTYGVPSTARDYASINDSKIPYSRESSAGDPPNVRVMKVFSQDNAAWICLRGSTHTKET